MQLKRDIDAELEWEPAVNAAHVGVAVRDGVVTLSGHLDTYAEKLAIERAVLRVRGVVGLAFEVDVKLDPSHHRSDSDIAAAAESALRWHSLIPHERVRVKVEKGWVTLSGEVDWDYQRRSAEAAARTLTGVVGISNTITLKPREAAANISSQIRDALLRHAADEAQHIDVTAEDGQVILRGQVDSWAERAEAIAAAWAAPGVFTVTCDLTVKH